GPVGALGPWRPLIDPRANQLDLRTGQRILVLRHLIVAVESEQPPDDQALLAIPRNDGGPGLPSFHGDGPQIETKPVLLFRRTVALVTVRPQNRLDVAREVDWWRRRGLLRLERRPRQSQRGNCGDRAPSGRDSHTSGRV